MGAKSGPPPASGGTASKTKMLVGALVVVCLNYVFTELMDDSVRTCRPACAPLALALDPPVHPSTSIYFS